MTDDFLNTFGVIDRPRGNRNRSIPLTPSRDARPSDWSAVLIVFGGGAAFFFLLGLACRIAWQVLT